MIFVSCLDVNSVEKLTFNLQLAAVENVPLDKLAIVIPTASPDESDKETGYFADGIKNIGRSSRMGAWCRKYRCCWAWNL